MNLLNSQLVKNLADGELPEVKVNIENKSIINMCIGVSIVGVILILVYKIVKNI